MKVRHFFILLLLGIVVFFGWKRWFATPEEEGANAGQRQDRPVTVTLVKVSAEDMPIWLTGIGTAEAYNKVTVRPRVAGLLEEIYFTEGQDVKAGDMLARIDPRVYQARLNEAKAKVAQTAALLANARQDEARIGKLVRSRAESRQVFEQIEATVAQYVAQQEADAAAVEAAQLDLDFTEIKAPISGKTGLRMIDQGNLVTASQDHGLVVITQVQPISVIFTLPQSHLPALRNAMMEGGVVKIEALDEDGEKVAEGELELLDNEIDASSGTIKLKAVFPNEDQALWAGQFLSARILVETRRDAIVIPTEAIENGMDGPFVYKVNSDDTVEVRNVTLGVRVGGVTLIEQGLEADEVIVLDGQSKLQPGARIVTQTTES